MQKQPTPFAYDLDDADIRRERSRARDLRQSQWWKRKLARGTCHYCNAEVIPGDLTMDHVVPLARGGRTSKTNVVPACKDCNSRKKQLMPVEWVQYLEARRKEHKKRQTSPEILGNERETRKRDDHLINHRKYKNEEYSSG